MTLLVTTQDKLHIITSVDSDKGQIHKVEGFQIDSETKETKDLLQIGFRATNVEDILLHIDNSNEEKLSDWHEFLNAFKSKKTTTLINDKTVVENNKGYFIEVKAIFDESINTISFEVKIIDEFLNDIDIELSKTDIDKTRKITEEVTETITELATMAKIELNVVKTINFTE